LPFSVQSRLIEFEYLGGSGERDLEYEKMAEGYQSDIDFAFFVNNYNYSLSEYEELTPRQKLFIMKGWEDKLISETTHMRNAVLNAVSNSMRKKGSRFTDLWKKKQKKADLDYVKESLKIIQEVQEASDNSWLDLVYASSGLHRPKKKKEGV